MESKRSNRSKMNEHSQRNNATEFFDVESECDIDTRPEMCRVKLQHIKQVHMNALQKKFEQLEQIQSLILSLLSEKEQDE